MRIGPVCGLEAAFAAKMNAPTSFRTWTKIIPPLQGRWLAGGQTEGCRALDRAIPLHHRYAAVPLHLQGRNFSCRAGKAHAAKKRRPGHPHGMTGPIGSGWEPPRNLCLPQLFFSGGRVIFTSSPFWPGKLVNMASIRLGTR